MTNVDQIVEWTGTPEGQDKLREAVAYAERLAVKEVRFANTQDADAHIEEMRTQRLNALHFHQPVNAPAAYRYEGPKQGCPYCRDREGGC